MSDLKSIIKSVADSCAVNNKKQILKAGSMSAKVSVSHLLALSNFLKAALNIDSSLYSISISYGVGFFPKVLWVAVTKKGKRVSNSVSVALCFSKTGVGFVSGAMFFRRKTKGIYKTVDRSGEYISVEGGSSKSDYTNRFFNPKDFHINEFKVEELILHIKDSIDLMDKMYKSTEFSTI